MQPSGPRAGDGGRAGGAPRPSSAADEVPLVPAPAPSAAAAGDPASLPVAAAVAADGDDDGGCDAPRPLLLPATPQRLEFAGVSLELDVARARGGAGARKSGGGGGVGATAGGVAPPRRRLLWDVTGAALPCHLTAVMGATGSGKTSLMNILARRLVRSPRLHPSGRVTVNGVPRPPSWRAPYVEQHDLFFEALTVGETLLFAACLRCAGAPGGAAGRVRGVADALGLSGALATRVAGGGGAAGGGASGGERKRLAVALELLENPALLFLDEPTSGLDAASAQSLMQLLRRLASSGRTVVANVHQPRSGIVALLDSLVLLSEGRCVFSGLARDGVPFFEAHTGVKCPPYSNPADYWVDVISVPPAGSGGSGARRATAVRARVAALADACAARRGPLLGALRADGDAALARAALPAAGAAGAGAESVAAAEEGRAAAPGPAPAGGGGGARRWLTEFAALAARAGRLALRSRLENAVTLGRTALFSLLLGLIWRAPCAIHAHRHTSARPSLTLSPRPPAPRLGTGPDGSPQGVRNTGGLLFFSLLQMSFTTVFAVIFVFVGELATVGRERTAGTYCCSSYFLARLAVQMPRALLGAVLHCAPLYWMVALRPTASAFALFVAINLLVGLNCEAVTMVITSGASDMRVAAALAPLPVVIGILFGGFFVQPGAIPVWLRWIRYVTFVRWGFVAVVRNQFPTGPAADLLVPNAVLDVAQCCAVLLGMLAACYAGAFAVLRRNLPDYDASV